MSALTPSKTESAARSSDSAAQGGASTQAATDEEGFTFWDALDIINPLQHIPVVSSIYRELSGDKIGDVARIAGATLFGGPMGLAWASADYVLKGATGGHLDEHALAMIHGTELDGSPMAEGGTALASAQSYGDDNSESSSNLLAYMGSTPWQANGVSGSADDNTGSQLAAASGEAPTSLLPAAAAAATGAPATETVQMAAAVSSAPATIGTASATASVAAPATATTAPANEKAIPFTAKADGRAFALNRSRDMRQPSARVTPPTVDPFARINGTLNTKSAVEMVAPTASSSTPASSSATAETSGSMPLGMAAPDATPSPQILNSALQAQGLQPSGTMPLGLFEAPTSAQAPTTSATQSASPQAASSAAHSTEGTAAQQATAPAAPEQLPAWFDQAMQKAVANYERTGSLTGAPAAVSVTPKGKAS
jgi:hypothetical protein